MIILDTNVVSELFKVQPNKAVLSWVTSVSADTAITAITLAKLLAGIETLPVGQRQTQLAHAVSSLVSVYKDTRSILPFDEGAAQEYSRIVATAKKSGRPISTADAQIAAICKLHNAPCATRNIKDFQHIGLELINPWGQK